jgi:iron complex transport system substrate-binding protein
MRVVSLCPSTTESLIAFGCKEHLIGVTRFCIHPADSVADLPKVGGTKTPDLEKIAAAEPDLVFMNEEENRREDHAWLAERFEVDVSYPKEPGDVPNMLRRWGRRMDAAEAAEAWASAIEAELANPPGPAARGTRFAYLIWRKPWMAAGPDTYIDALLRWAGGQNVFAGDDRYPSFELDRLEALGPDRVLLSSEPFPFKEKHRPEVAAAVPSARVECIDGDDASWHGVRTLRGLRAAARAFGVARPEAPAPAPLGPADSPGRAS